VLLKACRQRTKTIVTVGQKVTFSFGFKDNTAKEGHFGSDQVK